MRTWQKAAGTFLVISVFIPAPAVAQVDAATVVLTEQSQAKPSRPVLDGLKGAAAQQGMSLEAAVDAHVAKAPKDANNWPDGPVNIPDVMIDDLSANFLDDLKAMARDFGITFAEAIERHGWMPRYKAIATELKSKYPNDFAGMQRESDGSAVWIGFRTTIPAEAVRLAKDIPTKVTLQGDLGYSEDELAAAKEETHQALRKDPEVAHVASSYDLRTGTIVVRVQPHANRGIQTERINAVKASGNPRIRRTTQVTDAIEVHDHDSYIRGGGDLGSCTSGFNLKYRTNSTKRHSTAGHCATSANTRSYCNQGSDGGCTTVTRVWWNTTTWGDIAYYTTGAFGATRTFYYNWSGKRYADGQDPYPRAGDGICKFGQTTGRTCTTVYDADTSIDGRSHLTVTNMLHGTGCAGGDSGGPYYFTASYAYGIHSGGVRYSGGTYYRCAFTHVKWLGEARDYLIYTR
ncbi:MAG TPA: S1 family peptidase [Candidatus Limnocylindrales bacterium]